MLELDTPHGPARAHLHPVDGARGALVLGHGAGGGIGAPDLVLAASLLAGEHRRGFAFEVDVGFAADVDGDGADRAAGERPGSLAGVVAGDWAAAVAAAGAGQAASPAPGDAHAVPSHHAGARPRSATVELH